LPVPSASRQAIVFKQQKTLPIYPNIARYRSKAWPYKQSVIYLDRTFDDEERAVLESLDRDMCLPRAVVKTVPAGQVPTAQGIMTTAAPAAHVARRCSACHDTPPEGALYHPAELRNMDALEVRGGLFRDVETAADTVVIYSDLGYARAR
jgi:hypothetical protein